MRPGFGIAACVAAAVVLGIAAAQAQSPPAARATPWFGVPTPGGLSDWDKPTFASNSDAYGIPAARWGKPVPAPFAGPKLMADVNTIVGFARERRNAGDPLWGRISGLAGEPKTVE